LVQLLLDKTRPDLRHLLIIKHLIAMTRNVWLFFILLILLVPGIATSQKKAERELVSSLERHLVALGRPDDTPARSGARQRAYLAAQFKAMGLVPRGLNHTYDQATVLDKGRRFEPGTSLAVNGHALTPETDFVPLCYSGTGTVRGTPLVAVQERKQPWIMDLGNYFDTQPAPGILRDSLYNLARQAVADQASAVVFYQSKATLPDLSFDGTAATQPLAIPVVYVTSTAASRYLSDPTASVAVQLEVSISPDRDTVYTLLAGIDHEAPTTAIIAASSPDDEAMLIELARLLKDDRKFGHQNYLFVAFPPGADRSPAIQSFTRHLPREAGKPGCLLFLDSAGGATLTLRGAGSSSGWQPLLDRVKERTPTRQIDTDGKPGLEIPGVAGLSFTGSGQGTGDATADAATVRFLESLLENINRRGNPTAH
jgi:hypothetical protein